MAFNEFKFDPEDGFLDSGYYEESPKNSREILQRQHNQTRDYINKVITAINSTKEGESGSEHIGSPKIDGVSGENVFLQIKDIKRQLENASAGLLADGSIKEEMLSEKCVSAEKIADNAVRTQHFNNDAVCPKAVDTLNLNGYRADMFEPVKKSGSFGNFKERVSDTVIKGVNGKTYNDARYFCDGKGKLMKLSLVDGAVSEYLDFSEYAFDFRVTFDENGNPYVGCFKKNDNYLYFNIYTYENGEITLINEINIGYYPSWTFYFNDMEIHNNILYFAYYEHGNYETVYIYKIPLEEISSVSTLASFAAKRVSGGNTRRKLVFVNNDLCFYNYVFKDCNTDNIIQCLWNFIEIQNGNIYVEHSYYILVDENYLPVYAKNYEIFETELADKSFIYNGYIYTILGDYLFRSRLC